MSHRRRRVTTPADKRSRVGVEGSVRHLASRTVGSLDRTFPSVAVGGERRNGSSRWLSELLRGYKTKISPSCGLLLHAKEVSVWVGADSNRRKTFRACGSLRSPFRGCDFQSSTFASLTSHRRPTRYLPGVRLPTVAVPGGLPISGEDRHVSIRDHTATRTSSWRAQRLEYDRNNCARSC